MEKPAQFEYGFGATPFGNCLLLLHGTMVAGLYFVPENSSNEAVFDEMKKTWTGETLIENQVAIEKAIREVFDGNKRLEVYVKGTDFQKNVWNELRKIKPGTTVSYEEIAKNVGKPKAVRAVGTAIGKNEIAYLIPCHRVVRKSGGLGGFRWGLDVKKRILDWEKVS